MKLILVISIENPQDRKTKQDQEIDEQTRVT